MIKWLIKESKSDLVEWDTKIKINKIFKFINYFVTKNFLTDFYNQKEDILPSFWRFI